MLKMKNKRKKSPLILNPLRIVGQSLDEEIQGVVNSEALAIFLIPFLVIGFTIYNWLLWYQIITIPNPLILTFFSIFLSIYSLFRFFKVRNNIRSLRLGRDGERAVGQTLDSLRKSGYRVFHDLVGQGFNIDHVLVSEYGVFCIETKTFSKPEKGECKVIVTEEGISINGFKSDRKILIQAEAQKAWLEKQITKLTGIKLTVKPVVVFPGWFIENRYKGSNVWVLEPKALPGFIRNESKIFTDEQVKLISNQMSLYIRGTYNDLNAR